MLLLLLVLLLFSFSSFCFVSYMECVDVFDKREQRTYVDDNGVRLFSALWLWVASPGYHCDLIR